MNYDKKKLNKVIKDIKNDLVIFCDNKKLLIQNMKKYENIKFFVETHKRKKYDYSDLLKLAELEFYIAEIEIKTALSNKQFREASSIYNNYFQNSSQKIYLLQYIQNSEKQYVINVVLPQLLNESNFDYRYKRINKLRNNITDEVYNDLVSYVDELNIKESENQITKLSHSNNYKLAFKYAQLIKNKEIKARCIKIILDNTKEYIKKLYNNPGYPKCKSNIDELLNKYSTEHKEEIVQYSDELKKIAILKNKIYSKLRSFDFLEADNIYRKTVNF